MSAEYTLVHLLIDSDIIIQNNESNTDSDTRNLVDSLQYHSRRLAYKLNAARYNKLHLVPKHKRKERGTATHTLSTYLFLKNCR